MLISFTYCFDFHLGAVIEEIYAACGFEDHDLIFLRSCLSYEEEDGKYNHEQKSDLLEDNPSITVL